MVNINADVRVLRVKFHLYWDDDMKVNIVIHPGSIQMRNFKIFFWNFGLNLVKEGDKRSDMRKGGGPNSEQKVGGGASGSLCLTLGTGPSFPFLDICHVIVIYHVTNFTDSVETSVNN